MCAAPLLLVGPSTPNLGIVFAPGPGGTRGTTPINRTILTEAAAAVSRDLGAAIAVDGDFRTHYPAHLEALVRLGIADPGNVAWIAGATLDAARRSFCFVRDGREISMAAAMALPIDSPFSTGTITGRGARTERLEVPYQGQVLRKEALATQLDRWVETGQIEPSAATKVRWIIDHPEQLDLRGQGFAVFGGTAEMGTLEHLLGWGATVAVIDVDRPQVWEGLIQMAQDKGGIMSFPIRGTQRSGITGRELAQRAGANVLTETPEIRHWLTGVSHQLNNPLTVCHYLYGKGELHTELAIAVDAILQGLIEAGQLRAFSCLLTPTHTYAIPEETARRSMETFEHRPWWKKALQGPMRTAAGWFKPNVHEMVTSANGKKYGLVNNLLTNQGPNYATAKWIEMMMALELRQRGIPTSATLAMWSWTRSVTQNSVFKAAYGGAAGLFGAEVWQPETSRAMNAACLVYDLHHPDSVANPTAPLAHPLELFMEGAMHGSSWTSPYATPSIATAAALGYWGHLSRGGRS